MQLYQLNTSSVKLVNKRNYSTPFMFTFFMKKYWCMAAHFFGKLVHS